MSTIYDYDFNGLTKELQKILRIRDWDIVVECITATDALNMGYDANTEGLCTRDRKHGDVLIEINVDHKSNKTALGIDIYNDGWMATLLHELFHVVTGEVIDQANTILEYVTDKTAEKSLTSELDIKQERLVNHLTKIMLSTLPIEELLSKYEKGNQDGSGSEKTQ